MENKHVCTVALEWGYEESGFTGQFFTKEELEREKKDKYFNQNGCVEFNFCPFCGKRVNENSELSKEAGE